MALLSVDQRKSRFRYLGLGEYNKSSIEKLQKRYLRKKDVDGIYGTDTDRLLRHVYNVRKYTTNFSPEEFRCECGGKYCTGYPSYMKKVELQNLQSIRTHFGRPMTVTCGLRCSIYNRKLRGSIASSKHLTGHAADFYMKGVTDTLANRKAAIKYIRKLPNHNYTYGNGINSNGVKVSAGYMGNALHTDTSKPDTTKQKTTSKATVTKALTPKKAADKSNAESNTVKKVSLVTKEQWLAAVKAQYEWSRNAVYAWVEGPNVQNSRKKNTCISLHSVALQRIGYLRDGKYFYFNPKKKKLWGNARSYVKKHTELFTVSYPNKTIKWLWKNGKIQIGDMVGYGDPGYHSMVFLGMRKNKKGKTVPIFATMGHKRGYGVTYPSYAGRKVNMIVHIKTK